MAAYARTMLKDRPVVVTPNNYYAAFTITAQKDIDDADRRQALEKLTTREKELLELN